MVAACSGAVALAAGAGSETAPAAAAVSVRGVEIAATPTAGTFVGTGKGRAGLRTAWRAVVQHARLGRGPAAITGGSFRMTTLRRGAALGTMRGVFTGGSVRLVSRSAGCGREVYAVQARLRTARGAGWLAVRLTHLRRSLLGRCIAYAAHVRGNVTLP